MNEMITITLDASEFKKGSEKLKRKYEDMLGESLPPIAWRFEKIDEGEGNNMNQSELPGMGKGHLENQFKALDDLVNDVDKAKELEGKHFIYYISFYHMEDTEEGMKLESYLDTCRTFEMFAKRWKILRKSDRDIICSVTAE